MEKHLADCDVLLQNEIITAFAVYFDDLIHLMMADVNFHQSWIGSTLLSHTEKQLFDAGSQIIKLETFEGNQQAAAFYSRNGWILSDKVKDEEYGFIRVCFQKRLR